jgi:hypothetical protein
MRCNRRLRTILLGVALEVGALAGVPMRPEQIRELLEMLARPKLVEVLRQESEKGDGRQG